MLRYGLILLVILATPFDPLGAQMWSHQTLNSLTPIQTYVRPSNSDHLICTIGGAVLASNDGGISFQEFEMFNALSSINFSFVPLQPESLFVRFRSENNSYHLAFSSNGGEDFEYRSPPDTISFGFSVTAPSNPLRIVYLADGTLWSSDDAGESWEGLTNDVISRAQEVTFYPHTDSVLYCIASDGLFAQRLYRSEDDGATWSTLDSLEENELYLTYGLQIDPLHPEVMYAQAEELFDDIPHGLVRSDDGGSHWSDPDLPGRFLGFDLLGRTLFFIDSTYFVSNDAGETVIPLFVDGAIPPGYHLDPFGSYRKPVEDPSDPNRFWVGVSGFFFRTVDYGATWQQMGSGPNGWQMRAIVPHPEDVNHLELFGLFGNVWQSEDQGNSWQLISMRRLSKLQHLRQDTNVIMRISLHEGGQFQVGSDSPELTQSSDTGQTWVDVTGELMHDHPDLVLRDAAMHPSDPTILYASLADRTAGFPTNALYVSNNHGESWEAVAEIGEEYNAGTLHPDLSDGQKVYFQTNWSGQLFRSDTPGDAFSLVNTDCNGVLYVDPSDGSIYQIFSTESRISQDSGVSFTPIFHPPGEMRTFAVHPTYAGRLIAGTTEGFFHSYDHGEHWLAIEAPDSPSPGALSIGIDGTLYMLDPSEGIWIGEGFLDVDEQSNSDLPINYELPPAYPNPFNPSLAIPFAVPERARVSLRIYNVLGREVATLINRDVTPGFHTVHWDASNLSSGIYFVNMSSGNKDMVQKVMLLR